MLKPENITPEEQAVIDWLAKNDKDPESNTDDFLRLWDIATNGNLDKSVRLYWICEMAK